MHQHFDIISPFWPIVDTTETTHYSVGKYLSQLLNALAQNESSFRAFFDTANRINRLLQLALENEEYMLVSLNVFTFCSQTFP